MIMLSQNDRAQMGQNARIFTTTYHDRNIIAKLYTTKAIEFTKAYKATNKKAKLQTQKQKADEEIS